MAAAIIIMMIMAADVMMAVIIAVTQTADVIVILAIINAVILAATVILAITNAVIQTVAADALTTAVILAAMTAGAITIADAAVAVIMAATTIADAIMAAKLAVITNITVMLMLLTATQHGMMKYADHIVLIADASLLKNNAAAASELKKRIQHLDFALQEVTLYLDMHPCDCRALRYYHRIKCELDKCMALYERHCAPISNKGNENQYEWEWAQSPWPWEGQE